jgi:hypothetical protein
MLHSNYQLHPLLPPLLGLQLLLLLNGLASDTEQCLRAEQTKLVVSTALLMRQLAQQ